MSNGKGSRPRNNHSQAFRDGWDRAFKPQKPADGQSDPSKALNGLKSQGNGLGNDSGSSKGKANDA